MKNLRHPTWQIRKIVIVTKERAKRVHQACAFVADRANAQLRRRHVSSDPEEYGPDDFSGSVQRTQLKAVVQPEYISLERPTVRR